MSNTTKPVNFRNYDYAALVRELDEDWNKPPVVYEFSNGRKFEDSGPHSGVYADEHG